MSGLSCPPGLSPDQGLGGSQGMSIGDGLAFQQLGPVSENGILLDNLTDFLVQDDQISLILQG